jgi:predicted dehydrogenase
VALKAARAKSHLFIEKPISHNLEGLEELRMTLDTHNRVAMVGYMLRFHPFFKQVKAWLDEGPSGTLGKPLFVRAIWGEHLPDWHPWEDYRVSYAANRDLGGGPALTLSHELDLLVWLFGHAVSVTGLVNVSSPLEVTCEHSIDILMSFSHGVTANIHLDYCQRPTKRVWELVCSQGQVQIDSMAGTLKHWRTKIGEVHSSPDTSQNQADIQQLPMGFDRNDLFIQELQYFFGCLTTGQRPVPGIEEATESVQMAHRALRTGTQ